MIKDNDNVCYVFFFPSLADFEAIERDSVMMDIMETQSTVIQQETQQNPWANHSLVIKGGRGPVEDSAMCGPGRRKLN